MLAETIESARLTERSNKLAFFRQSGWMMIATVGSGVLMYLVHVYAKVKALPKPEYGTVLTMLQLLAWMTIPTVGLQSIFAQQASGAVTEEQRRQLVGTFKAVMKGTFGIWLVMLLITLIFHGRIVAALQLDNARALWITVAAGLMMLWQPILQGMLQGRQNFLWLGWVAVFNGIGRIGIAGILVFLLNQRAKQDAAGPAGWWAAGIMAGALMGLLILVAVAAWQNWDLWTAPSAPFAGKEWLKRVVPLTLGCGASQFLFSADMIVVKHYFSEVEDYGFGMTLARSIVLFTAPLVAVMFPKIVRSAALSHKSNLMALTFLGTGLLAVLAALALPIVAPFAIKLSKPEFASILPFMPWLAWSMVPLAIGNVLLNNLMARSQFAVVPWLVAVAVGYWFALLHHHDTFRAVAQTLGIFSLLLLAVCAWFTWGRRSGSEA